MVYDNIFIDQESKLVGQKINSLPMKNCPPQKTDWPYENISIDEENKLIDQEINSLSIKIFNSPRNKLIEQEINSLSTTIF